jgi:hypothetical protein
MASAPLTARHWIGGDWVDSKNRLDSINPATGETIGTYSDGGEAAATQAIAVAMQAFLQTGWRETRNPLRGMRYASAKRKREAFECRGSGLADLGWEAPGRARRARDGLARCTLAAVNGASVSVLAEHAGRLNYSLGTPKRNGNERINVYFGASLVRPMPAWMSTRSPRPRIDEAPKVIRL